LHRQKDKRITKALERKGMAKAKDNTIINKRRAETASQGKSFPTSQGKTNRQRHGLKKRKVKR